ncbi:MAG: ribosome biogenesis GTP-binding protein YihA/YsxC [Oligoflexales bacterium]
MHAEYLTSVVKPDNFPIWDYPEIAFIGRSNCGKSSLLNALLGRKSLARTSSTPGRTQAINFFNANNQAIFADLPGYGYSKVAMRMSKSWDRLISEYLKRPEVKDFLCLTDIRRRFSDDELAFMEILHHEQYPITIVLTKSDKINKSECQKSIMKIREQLVPYGITPKAVHAISSLKRQGLEKLKQQILSHEPHRFPAQAMVAENR